MLHGPSGSGKTQLLRALALLDPLARGEVLWHGSTIPDAEVPSYRSRVIYHQQTPALFEGSVEENLRRPLALAVHAGRRFDAERTADLFDRLGRVDLASEAAIDDLSGGERQLVSLVRLLLLEPEVVLLDEPTASLDAATQDRALDLLLAWAGAEASKRALVWVTHDRSLAQRVGSRSLELVGGALRAAISEVDPDG